MSDTVSDTTTDSVEPIEVNGGDGPISFDDLEQIEAQSKAAKRAEKSEVKETAKEVAKELEKSSKKDNEKSDSTKKADGEEEDDKKDSGKKEAKSKEVDKPAQKEKKLLKGKLGDKSLDLDPDTMVTIPVDGKDTEVSVRDLQRHFTGKVSYEKKFSDLDNERKAFHSKVEGVSSKIKDIFSEPDPELRIFKMAELSGKDPVEVRQKFLEDNIKLLEKYYAMSEDERKADARDFENKVLKHRLEFKQQEDARRDAKQVLQRKITDLGTTHQIPEEKFWERFEELEAYKKQGTFKEKITPEFVVETIRKDNLWNAASEVLENNKDLNWTSEKRSEALLNLVETAYLQGIGANEIKSIAEDLWGKGARASVVEAKLEQQEELRTGRKGSKKPEYTGDNEVIFFDDL